MAIDARTDHARVTARRRGAGNDTGPGAPVHRDATPRYPEGPPREEPALRIAIVIERFVPGAGGVENVAWQVAHALAECGEDVVVWTREADPRAAVASRRVRAPRAWQPIRILGFSAGVARGIARAARGETGPAWDVVHSFSHTRHQDLFRAGGGSQIETLRRTRRGLGRTLRRGAPRYRVRLAIERHVFERTQQRIQCPSRLVADALEREHGVDPARLWLLPNAVDASRFAAPQADEAGRALRARLAPRAERVWLFPGTGWHRKGLATALEALARDPDAGSELWIAGRDAPGPWQRRARGLGLGDRVRFLGEWRDMPALYRAVDGVVLPTRYDPFANVTLEAAAAGRPVATSATNGAAEWLGDDVDRIERADDAEALAARLATWRDDGVRRARGGALARRAAAMDWAGHVAALRDEYARIAEARRRSAAASAEATATATAEGTSTAEATARAEARAMP